jgi:hypothetical protein
LPYKTAHFARGHTIRLIFGRIQSVTENSGKRDTRVPASKQAQNAFGFGVKNYAHRQYPFSNLQIRKRQMRPCA